MFNHIHHDIAKLERVTTDTGRVYNTPSGKKYPSVTSVLGIRNKASLIEWRKRVGEEEANRVSARASNRGTRIHGLCEDYLSNLPANPDMFDLDSFRGMQKVLDKIDNIHCLETQLYSDYLKVAGTVDCIAEFEGKLSVIDFKTSTRIKHKDDIHDYFLQTSAYAVMFEERTGIPVSRLVIIMATDEQNEPLIFKEKRDQWIKEFMEVREDYFKIKGN